ncbi:MAG TPA: hypothetical protein VHR86_07775, partial [Armatimonadota bacterium]|nr:hypothetical protein [Armatimonadota bacterium]
QEWNVDVGGGQAAAGNDITLTWPDLRSLPSNLSLQLIDDATHAQRSLRTSGSYTFRADGEAARRLRIVAKPRSSTAVLVTGLEMTTTRGGTRSVRFTLSQEASIDLDVLSPTGSKVAAVARGRASVSGVNQVTWKGEVPAGIYLLRVTATTEDGQMMQTLRPVVLVR